MPPLRLCQHPVEDEDARGVPHAERRPGQLQDEAREKERMGRLEEEQEGAEEEGRGQGTSVGPKVSCVKEICYIHTLCF